MAIKTQRKLTQDERSAISDQRLVDAAIKLIVTKGTSGTTLQALGDASGYSRGLVTYRFGTKDGLLKAVIKQVSERWSAMVDKRVAGMTGVQALMACSDAYFHFVQESPDDIHAMNILNQQACEPDSALKDIVCKVMQLQKWQLVSWIKQGQSDEKINSAIDADAYAIKFSAFHTGMTFLWMLDRRHADWQCVHQQAKQQLMNELTV